MIRVSFSVLAGLAVCTFAAESLLAQTSGGSPTYRDLNHNGRLDPYEDARLNPEQRVEDLLAQMTVAEKVGSMVHGTLPGKGGFAGMSSEGYALTAAEGLIRRSGVTSLLTRVELPPVRFAEANNEIQRIAQGGRLGIPVTISTDPRNHFVAIVGAAVSANGFSQWPEPLGLAALGDAALVCRFGEIAAREYRAVGIQMALSPQADLATEPRWSRGTATFGSDPRAVSNLARAYISGFQGSATGLRPGGVATIVKHWVGYGAQPEGLDAHNYYGRIARLDNRSFAQHVAAFRGPLAAGTTGVMPAYPIITGVTIDGEPLEAVAPGFNRQIVAGLLRGKHKFDGLVVSDWAITNDCPATCSAATVQKPQSPMAIAMPWGVESLSREDRFVKGVEAGVDQFGGVDDPAPLLAAVKSGRISMARVDASVRRILLVKFRLGLFDNPYVDPAAAGRIVGNPAAVQEAQAAQRSAAVLLQNRGGLLPLGKSGLRVWLHGVDPVAARAAGFEPVATPEESDFAIVRAATPSEKLHPQYFFGSRQNEGRLDFRTDHPAYLALERASGKSVIFAVDMDRPAILTNVQGKATAVFAIFGASDSALLDLVAGKAAPRGRLPFELPRSMAAVAAQDPARADDSVKPLYRRGYGLRYQRR